MIAQVRLSAHMAAITQGCDFYWPIKFRMAYLIPENYSKKDELKNAFILNEVNSQGLCNRKRQKGQESNGGQDFSWMVLSLD